MSQYYTEETISLTRKIATDNSNSIVVIPKGTILYHAQWEGHKEPFFFHLGLDHRFADQREQVGLMYFAFGLNTMLLESFKKRVLTEAEVEEKVFYEFRLNQDLRVANIPVFSTCLDAPYEQLLEKEDGPNGYSRTQAISTWIMTATLPGVGGLSYHSRENPDAGFGHEGQCLALFKGNENLFDLVRKKSLRDFAIPGGQTVFQLLASYGKRFEVDVPA